MQATSLRPFVSFDLFFWWALKAHQSITGEAGQIYIHNMTLKEVIHNEDISGNQIHLYREGLFWKAYEHSAYRFVFGINPYKPLKKTIKAAGQDVVSIGFPTTSLEKFATLFSIISQNDNHIVIKPENIEEENASHQKIGYIRSARVSMVKVKLRLRIAHDLKE